MAVFDCYHGTECKAAESILEQRQFVVKRRDDHWLGNGVYFFLDDKRKAAWWAYIVSRRANRKAVVMYVPISVNTDELLNLNTEEDLALLDKFAHNLEIELRARGIAPFFPNEHQWACFVLDRFFKANPNFKAVKRTFKSAKKYVGPSRFEMLSEQFCVINQDIIDFKAI